MREAAGDKVIGAMVSKNANPNGPAPMAAAPGGSALPAGVDLMVFDHGVNAGPARGVRSLQAALGFDPTDQDGANGPHTIAAATAADATATIGAMADNQEAYYRSLASFADFGNGWLARLGRRKAAALAMIATS